MSTNVQLGATFRDFVIPLKENLAAPFNLAWQDLKVPFTAVWKSPSLEHNQKLLSAIARPLLAFGLVLAHRFAWSRANQDFGHLGSAVCCAVLYEVGNYLDPKTNYMGSSAWLLLKGASGLLKSEGSDRISMVCLLLLKTRTFDATNPSRLFDNFPVKNVIDYAAQALFWAQQKYLNWNRVDNPSHR